jgi:hypothetical protein
MCKLGFCVSVVISTAKRLCNLSFNPKYSKLKIVKHYRNQLFCRVSKTLGKACKTLDECFVECDTHQIKIGKLYIGNGFFAEYFLSGTRERLCRLSPSTRQRKVAVTAAGNDDGAFAECIR